MTTTNLAELADDIEAKVKEAYRLPALDLARSAANEAGLNRSRASLEAAAKSYEYALPPFREAQAAERRTKEALDAALAEAEWTLNAKLVTKANKRHLVVGGEEKALTADEVKQWKAAEAHKLPEVAEAREAYAAAVRTREDAADAVALAERYFAAASLEVKASISQLNALVTALGRNP